MNNELFTELDKLTDNSIDYTVPEIGTEIIVSTSDGEVEEFKE